VVHHYAWTSIPASANNNPFGDLTSNVTGTLALLEALRRRGDARIVFASSGGTVYGRLQKIPVSEDHPLMPITAYGAGKATAEIYLGLYRVLHGLDCRVARIANPYGAGQNLARGQGAVTTFVHHALTNQPIVIWGDGEVVRDYIHVTDVATAMVALALRPHLDTFRTFNIGSGTGVSLNTLIAELESRLNRRLDVRREPARPFDVPVSVLDISRARNILGWVPRLSFAEGIARTMSDLAGNAALSD
jgi:UDP-glucose 4-epimerase